LPEEPEIEDTVPIDEPDGTEPDGTEPDGTEPDGTEPDGTEPDGTQTKNYQLSQKLLLSIHGVLVLKMLKIYLMNYKARVIP
jgi:hypothetical protein